ncbi:hypothetical protein [Sphingomonas sp. Leaf38]|uniref:hypothetical protein n=1 Tax=Sphingomonas sp. Leaf38 TaxID=1736217 RepID=UPI000700786B|nr:hypothetical protein [Sphingomonas sp. Leaf38]KQN28760.1 hypothetical protein ASE88_06965 [Sphingomonas sp. Leaf38]
MAISLGIFLFVASVVGMAVLAYAAQSWIMHGFGWRLRESHHRAQPGNGELNDLYAAIFAVPSFVLVLGGMHLDWWPGFAWIGAGVATCGMIYFGFHDVEPEDGHVSFGFLVAPKPENLRAKLTRRFRMGMRAPVLARAATPQASES